MPAAEHRAPHTGLGSWAWSQRGGNLRQRERVQLMAQALISRMAALPPVWRKKLGWHEAQALRLDVSALRLPDSPFARSACEHASALSPPWLLNHCLRTYVWGSLLGQLHQIPLDEELFFSACVLHDLGLVHAHNGADATCSCFAVEGARAAHTFAEQHQQSAERCDRLAQAISLHLNVRVGLEHGAEAHLLHEGTTLDMIGARARELHPDTRRAVHARYPRLDLAAQMTAAMHDQAGRRPQSRASFLVGLGFNAMVKRHQQRT